LRGVDKQHPGNGIFSCRPEQGLIEGMDCLFSGNEVVLLSGHESGTAQADEDSSR
jgi:exodeoxyribonuclease V beta subunit